MKLKKMPTTIVLTICSWLIGVSGLFIGGFYCFSSLKIGVGIIFAGIILAAVIRVFGNIGEMIFNLNADLKNTNQILCDLTQTLNDNFQSIREILLANFQNIQQNLQQINSDSRDINQNLHNIWLLFENVTKTLER